MLPRERVFLSDAIGVLSRPYFWILAPIFNWLVHPTMDAKVRRIVTCAAQGNDRPTATIYDVTPWPLRECRDSCPPLPDSLNAKLRSYADEHARDIAPKLRCLLAQPSFTSGIAAFSKELSGKELIHTSYFDHAELLDLIACNIAWGTSRKSLESRATRMHPQLAAWFAESKFRNLDRKRVMETRPHASTGAPHASTGTQSKAA
jgi:hypothetical protein